MAHTGWLSLYLAGPAPSRLSSRSKCSWCASVAPRLWAHHSAAFNATTSQPCWAMRARICWTASSTALLGSLSCAATSSTLACAGAASRLGTRTVNAGVIVRSTLTHQHIKMRAEGVRSVVVSGLLPEASFMREAFLQLPQQAACHSQEQAKWVAPAGVKHFMLMKGSVGQQQAKVALCRVLE